MAVIEHCHSEKRRQKQLVLLGSPSFSFFCLASCGVRGFSSTLGVSNTSSSLPPAFAADFFEEALGLEAFFLLAESAAGVLGVDNLSLVAVLGVFAGYG